MRLLLTIGDLSVTGGAERVVVNLANAFARTGILSRFLAFIAPTKASPTS